MQELISGEDAGKKKAPNVWDNRCQQAFDELKCLCTTAPILPYADFTSPCNMHTNACGSGLEAIIYQTYNDGMDAIILYASRNLTKAGTPYLTLSWAVVDL